MSSMKLRELIRSIRLCKTAAEERAVIQKECAFIRNSFREEQTEFRSRNIAKLLFINLLGFETPFGQVECLKLIVSPKYSDKRIGYLALVNLLNEGSEVLMMVTNSIKKDLNSDQHSNFIIALALTAVGEIGTPEMCRELTPEIKHLMKSERSYIRKKATLTAIRVIRRVPEMAEDFANLIEGLLNDKTHGTMLAALALLKELIMADPIYKTTFRKLINPLVKTLQKLLVSGYAPDYDISGIVDPFLQSAILQVFRLFGEDDTDASDEMSDVLAHLASNTTDYAKNLGNAILYECSRTILGIASGQGLKTLAINILARFLFQKENNVKYVALTTLKQVVALDYNAVQRHKATILELCIRDPDISIRKSALNLLYQLINKTNVKAIIKELTNNLLIADNDYKEELASTICLSVEKYAPTRKWHIDTQLKVLTLAGNYVREIHINSLIHLISATPKLQGYSSQRAFFALQENIGEKGLAILGLWLMGEYGLSLLSDTESEALDGTPVQIAEGDVLDLIEIILDHPKTSNTVKEYCLTALLKLSIKMGERERIYGLIDTQTCSANIELQQRACEFIRLFDTEWQTNRTGILEPIPVSKLAVSQFTEDREVGDISESESRSQTITMGNLDQSKFISSNVSGKVGKGEIAPKEEKGPPPPPPPEQNLISLLMGVEDTETETKKQDVTGGGGGMSEMSVLNDIFANLGAPTEQPVVGDTRQMGLLLPVDNTPPVTNAEHSPPKSAPPTSISSIMSLYGNSGDPTQAAPMSSGGMGGLLDEGFGDMQGANTNSMTVFEDNNITITFTWTKDPLNPPDTKIMCYFSNRVGVMITALSSQIAVQKYLKMTMLQASGMDLPPMSQNGITQQLNINNSMHGEKRIILKLRISYNVNGQQVVQTKVAQLPEGV